MSTQIAARYAQALFSVIPQADRARTVEEFKNAALVLRDPQVAQVFFYPRTSKKRKGEMIRLLGLSHTMEHFLLLLVEKSRDVLLPFIAREFEKLVLEAQNTAVAEVTSAVTLSDASLARLTKRLEELSRKKIILRNKVDPKIGGGLIIRIGGRVVDASVSNALQRLAQSLSLDK